MARQAVDVTDTQLAMLQVLWERGEGTRRDVTDALYAGGGLAGLVFAAQARRRARPVGVGAAQAGDAVAGAHRRAADDRPGRADDDGCRSSSGIAAGRHDAAAGDGCRAGSRRASAAVA